MQSTAIIISLIGILTLSLAANLDLPYKVASPEFTTTLGGRGVQFNGTVQEFYAQIRELHPDAKLPATTPSDAISLLHRASDNNKNTLCIPIRGQSWSQCNADASVAGILYLNDMKKDISMAARSCGRISCSYQAAIYVCNDNSESITKPSSDFASHANNIVKNCRIHYGFFSQDLTGGQEFDTDNGYNVIVRQDSC